MSGKNSYSIVDQLAGRAQASLGGGNSPVLTMIILLSAVLSAIFFWQNSSLVFKNVSPTLALFLGLAVGLVPSEGAFFGWKQVRSTKMNMTSSQLTATTVGIVTAVVSSIFSTLALYVVSFNDVPGELLQYRDWLVFLSLSVPLVCQVGIYAWFEVNERMVVENHERSKLDVILFNDHIKSEKARLGAIMEGKQAELERLLEGYGVVTGGKEAQKQLGAVNPQPETPSANSRLSDEEILSLIAGLSAQIERLQIAPTPVSANGHHPNS